MKSYRARLRICKLGKDLQRLGHIRVQVTHVPGTNSQFLMVTASKLCTSLHFMQELAWSTRTQTEAPQPQYSTADMRDPDNEGLLLTATTPLPPYLPVWHEV